MLRLQPDALLSRRALVAAGAGALAWVTVRPAFATDETTSEAIRKFLGEASVKPGRVTLELPPLVENGNAVPMTVSVDSPMSIEDHVKTLAVFNEKNPQPHVATFHFGPHSGRAVVATRIRLADSQTVTAIAEMSDGSFWSTTADVVVTLAACVEGL